MDRVIFVRSNYTRKPNFQIKTIAHTESGKIVFTKSALSDKSISHINNINKTYELAQSLGVHKQLVAPSKQNGDSSVDFELIKGCSFEDMLVNQLLEGKDPGKLLDTYEALLDVFVYSEKAIMTQEISHIFGKDFYNMFKKSKYIMPGIVDLNFDNIISDQNNHLKVIDYEFSFNSPLPYDFVLYRSLMWLGLRFSEQFKLIASRTNIVKLSDDIFLPQTIIDRYPDLVQNIATCYSLEWKNLQIWINGKHEKKQYNIHAAQKYNSVPLSTLDEMSLLKQKLADSEQSIHEYGRIVKEYQSQLNTIQSSKSFKAGRAITSPVRHARNIIKKMK